MAAPMPRRTPMRSIQPTKGDPSAAIRSAMITGIVSSAKNSTPRNRAYVAMPITISRQAQAAARSSPHGTWAGAKFEDPVSIAGCARGGVRRLSHWWARRPARRSPAPSSPGASGAVEASLLTGSTYATRVPVSRRTRRRAASGCSPASRPTAAST